MRAENPETEVGHAVGTRIPHGELGDRARPNGPERSAKESCPPVTDVGRVGPAHSFLKKITGAGLTKHDPLTGQTKPDGRNAIDPHLGPCIVPPGSAELR